MKQDEILQAAKEAMRFPDGAVLSAWMPSLERFAAIIEKRTIERCAEYVNEVCTYGDTHLLVKAIRKLGEQE